MCKRSDFPRRAFSSGLFRWLLLLLLVAATSGAMAAVRIWDGSSNGNWSTAANWDSGVPVNGDSVVFPNGAANLANTNNLTNLRLDAMTLSGSGYFLRGNAITLTNGVNNSPVSGANSIQFGITNAGTQTFNCVNAAATLTLSGLITGSGGLTKSGSGTVLLAGSINNTYAGVTTVSAGTLELNDSASANAMVPGDLVISAGSVLLSEGNQIADTSDVTIGLTAELNLNGFSETIASLTFNGGDVTTGVGTLTLGGDLTANSAASPADITGNLNLGGVNRTIAVALGAASPGLNISAVTSNGGIIKSGAGTLELGGANTYAGLTTINQGFIEVVHASGLGSVAGATVLNAGHLLMNNVSIVGETLTNLSSVSALQATGASGWSGNAVINAQLDITVFASTFDMSGIISGTNGIRKAGTGTLRLSGAGANTFTGTMTVDQGTLELNKSVFDGALQGALVVGDGTGTDTVRHLASSQISNSSSVTLNQGSVWDLDVFVENIGALTMTGASITGTGANLVPDSVTVNASTVQSSISKNILLADTPFTIANGSVSTDLLITGEMTGPSGFTKFGDGQMRLAVSNSYSGTTFVNAGLLTINNDFGLGATGSGTVVNAGGSLAIGAGVHIGAEPLTLNGPGMVDFGALYSFNSSNSWAGPVTLATDSTIETSSTLNLGGSVGGPGGLTKTGTGDLIFDSPIANTYNGTTTVNEGTLVLSSVADAINGPLIIGDGLGGTNADAVRIEGGATQLGAAIPVVINSSGLLEVVAVGEGFGSLAGTGNVIAGGPNIGVGGNNTSTTFSGVISGAGGLIKNGVGTMTLSGNNTYTGATTVNAGVLLVDGQQPQSPVTVAGAGTLGGNGRVGSINNIAGGVVAPGASPGSLVSSNVVFSGASSDYTIELNGPAAGTGYDQLLVRGTVSLGGSTLNVSVGGGFAPLPDQTFTIIDNDTADATAGTFAGLPNGTVLSSGVHKFRIAYNGGTGNDVTLTFTNPALAAVTSQVSAGNGNAAIEPDECNRLGVVVTNTSGAPLTGISAVLSSSTPGVVITQPESDYANIAVNGTGTNLTAFQISTLPTFVCGTTVDFVLTVTTASGSFGSALSIPTPGVCNSGGGVCETCPGLFTNAITTNDLVRAARIGRDGIPSTCLAPKVCPGTFVVSGPFHFDNHTFTNTSGGPACVTVTLDTPCSDSLSAEVYLNSHNTNDLCTNYLADLGLSPSPQNGTFSFTVTNGAVFVVVVTEASNGSGCNYTLVVDGLCPTPVLKIRNAGAQKVVLDWTTAAGGYRLESTNKLSGGSIWQPVTNEPIVINSRFNVTNDVPNTNRFYWLHKP